MIAEEGRLNKDIYLKASEKSGIVFDGSQVLYGKLRPYLHNWLNPDFKGVAVGDWWVLNPNDIDKNFLYRLIQSSRFDNIANQSSGSKMPRADWNLISNSEFLIPLSKEEQNKIGAYFDNLDNLITLHQCKCDNTKIIIYIAWEQRKFADFTWNAGKRNKEDLDLEPYAITNERGFIRQCDAHDDFGYMKDTDRKAYNIVKSNSFAYNPARINVGSIGYYKGSENVIVSSLYEVFQTDNYVNDRFLWHWFKSDEFPRWIEKLQEGSVRLYFYYDKLCECQLYMSSVEEQEKIASFLDNLDCLITLHQQKYIFAKYVSKYAKNDILEAESASVGGSRTSFWKKEIFNMGMMTVYHGGYKAVEQPEIRKGRNTKDFGTGFYCTIIKEQAQRWARRYDTKVVSIYDVRMEADLNIKEFKEMTEEWLDFIVACRSGLSHDYDIVIGAMADDQIYNYVSDYMDGVITREQFWVLAKFKYPTHQIAFCTERSLKCLEYRDCEVL